MANATVFTSSGTKSTKTVALPKAIFELELKDPTLLKQAYRTYLANGRMSGAKTLKRGEVRGGGKKPWRQKGTGRARAGSRRSPIWTGGGITFGPTGDQNFKLGLAKKPKKLAIRQALSVKAADGAIKIIEDFGVKAGKTKEAVAILEKLEAKRRILVVVSEKTDALERSVRNLPEVRMCQATYVNVFSIMNADAIIITQEALKQIETWLTADKKVTKPAAKPKAKSSEAKPSEDAGKTQEAK